jgi:nitrite reductase/ring-hydroxylating ferredoxin subunit
MPAESSIKTSSPKTSAAPSADQFPDYPACWYLFGAARDVQKSPVSKKILGRQLVAFRTASGTLSVMDANCAHMGADLGCGKVVGETIQCPFHNWLYGADGVCKHIPGASKIPALARLRAYPVAERHGYLFFFNGWEPLFPLPFFFGEDPQDYAAGGYFRYIADCNWYMNAAHAFDMQHFASVHDRELIGPPEIDYPAPFARRNRYFAKVVGESLLDRLLRWFAGKTVEITISVCGGTFLMVTGNFGRAHSRFIIAAQPQPDGQTLCEGIVFARSTHLRLLDKLNLFLRRVFTHGYLAAEASQLRGTRYNPKSLGSTDLDMIEFFQWVAALPQTAATATQTQLSYPEERAEGHSENNDMENGNMDHSLVVPLDRGPAGTAASAATER